MGAERILVVDDAADTREVLSRNLTGLGFQVMTAPGAAEALRILEQAPVDLVITDMKMPRISGLDLVRHVRENLPDTEVMMITGYPTVEGAVAAVKSGAEDYLAKPFTDEELRAAVDRALRKLRDRRASRTPVADTGALGMIGSSAAMRKVVEAVERAASTTATMLITGESGTGKELIARAIHYRGPRSGAPFVAVNCGGIPESLAESELFGHVRGAFTGAAESRGGFFQAADHGTIFLDEVSEAPPSIQVKLLRVLESKDVLMVGSTQPQPIDVRVIAATNKELRRLVDKGRFREDLYFRLHVLTLEVPPLRERADDVLPLVAWFARKYAEEAGRPAPTFSDRALEALRAYAWPGNVRELENLVQRLVVMNESSSIDVADLPPPSRFSLASSGPLRTLAEVEAGHIRAVLEAAGGNKTRAAQILGIDRKTLREKLARMGISDAE